jgi:2,5-diamino-6-(ribosylamino)-4(3H)-pyrimidinone 5'-phosphate reductase
MNSGRVQAKIGVNEREMPEKSPVSFVLLDNSHLTEHGVRYFAALSDKFVLVTSNKEHPAFGAIADNLHIIYQEEPSLEAALERLWGEFGCERLTVETGGTLNAALIAEGLIDYVDIVVAPVIIGGKDTASMVDGPSITTREELSRLGVLRLIEALPLEDSYLRLKYEVINRQADGER